MLENLTADAIAEIKSGNRVYFDATLYSVKKHHGGKAVRQANSTGDSAAAKKFKAAMVRSTKVTDKLSDDFDWDDEEDNGSTSAGVLPYGHSGSVNKSVLAELSSNIDEVEESCNKVRAVSNILNYCVQLKLSQNFDANDQKATYDLRKEALIKKMAINGVIPAENKQAYIEQLSKYAFTYYEHQVTVRIFTDVPLNEQSRQESESGIYVTYIRSVKWYSKNLLSPAELENLQQPCDVVKDLEVYTDLTVLYVRKNAKGKLFVSRRRETPDTGFYIPGVSNISDDYS